MKSKRHGRVRCSAWLGRRVNPDMLYRMIILIEGFSVPPGRSPSFYLSHLAKSKRRQREVVKALPASFFQFRKQPISECTMDAKGRVSYSEQGRSARRRPAAGWPADSLCEAVEWSLAYDSFKGASRPNDPSSATRPAKRHE